MQTLTTLYLQSNLIDDEGVGYLAEGLKKNMVIFIIASPIE